MNERARVCVRVRVLMSVRTSIDCYKLQFVAYKNCFKFPDGKAWVPNGREYKKNMYKQ